MLLIAGVGIPALFGFIQTKATEIGVNDLLESSTQFDSSNIANSTYFINEVAQFNDNETQQKYKVDIIFDKGNNLDLFMGDTSGTVLESYTGADDWLLAWIYLNKTSIIENADKIAVSVKILDPATADLSNRQITIGLLIGSEYLYKQTFNATDAINRTLTAEITLDAIKILKLSSADTNPYVFIQLPADDLDNVILGYRVDLYNTKKVDSNLICNSMLAIGGFVMMLGAFAATPFWNPTHEGSRTRRVLGKARKIGRKRR